MTKLSDAQMEAEANEFAMELLMPTKFLLNDIKNGDITDDNWIEKLANKYRVPAATMAIRIGQLTALKAHDA